VTPRWLLKRILKWGVELGSEISGAGFIYRNSSYFKNGFRILTYHRITKNPLDSYSLKTSHFKDHVAFLTDHYPVVSLQEMALGLQGRSKLDNGSVCISFDDGYSEAAGVVGDILARFNAPACFFVITGILDKKTEYSGGGYLEWHEVKELKKSGFNIGSHTVTHRSLGALSLHDVELELKDSFDRLEQELGTVPDGISYPYGTLRDFSDGIVQATHKCGYPYAVTAIHGLNHIGCDQFRLNRTTITAGDGLKTFKLIMKGSLDAWRIVDQWGYRLQRPSSSLE